MQAMIAIVKMHTNLPGEVTIEKMFSRLISISSAQMLNEMKACLIILSFGRQEKRLAMIPVGSFYYVCYL